MALRPRQRYAVLTLHERLPSFSQAANGLMILKHRRQHYDLLRHLGLLSADTRDAPDFNRDVKVKVARPAFGWRPRMEKLRLPDLMPTAPAPKSSGSKASGKGAKLLEKTGEAFSRVCELIFMPPPRPGARGGFYYGYRRKKWSEDLVL
ncbi:MAG: hypothetical protein PHY92_10235 [Alphaproteobacteria bacterium]|nr:hypothetical protein [Alphaproteobacteria bacterium]